MGRAREGIGYSLSQFNFSTSRNIFECSCLCFSSCRQFVDSLKPAADAAGFTIRDRDEQACKPGSVRGIAPPERPSVCGPPLPTGSSHLLRAAGPAFMLPFHGVAPDRVYSVHMSPCDGWALTPPFHPYRAFARRYISVALVRGSPLAGVARYPCPAEPGLSSRTVFRTVPAVVRPAHRRLFYSFSSAKSTNILVIRGEKEYNKLDLQKYPRPNGQQDMVAGCCRMIMI